MDEMQRKLDQYRLRKRRKEKFEEFKSIIKSFLMLGTGQSEKSNNEETTIIMTQENLPTQSNDAIEDRPTKWDVVYEESSEYAEEEVESPEISNELRAENQTFKYTLWILSLLFWITLYIIAIELRFGIVFLMFSALLGIYFNTRTGPKKANEISAYSVFNKNFESIDGTLKAEQFEREMIYGPAGLAR